MDPFRIIGLYSPAPSSGKSTSAKYIQNTLGLVAMSFSSPMKLLLLKFVLNFAPPALSPEQAYSWANGYFEDKNKPIAEIPGSPTMRHLLDSLGTTWGRGAVHDDVWLAAARSRLLTIKDKGMPGVVFDDVRFTNEAELIRSLGGKFIKIIMPGREADPTLQSEGNLEDFPFDATVVNGGSKGDLFKLITTAVKGLF